MKKLNLVAMLLFCTMTIFSCAKKEGCTVNTAKNFDSKAEKDDGSCQYEGRLTFWNNLTSSNNMIAAGISRLTYFVDGVQIGEENISYYDGAPECNATGIIGVTKSFGGSNTKNLTYSIKDQNSNVVFSGTKLVDSKNSCAQIELVY